MFTPDTFLLSLQPQIEQMARKLYYRVNLSITIDDLVQEGLIGVWQCLERRDHAKETNEHSVYSYCITRAKGAMLNFLDRENRTPATSLEAYLEVETDQGTRRREIAASSTTRPKSKPKKPVHDALRKLSHNERQCIMAAFRIDNTKGKSPTPDEVQARLHITADSFSRAKRRGMQKLPGLMNQKQAVWS